MHLMSQITNPSISVPEPRFADTQKCPGGKEASHLRQAAWAATHLVILHLRPLHSLRPNGLNSSQPSTAQPPIGSEPNNSHVTGASNPWDHSPISIAPSFGRCVISSQHRLLHELPPRSGQSESPLSTICTRTSTHPSLLSHEEPPVALGIFILYCVGNDPRL